jgi:large subunit ribosomal protein L18
VAKTALKKITRLKRQVRVRKKVKGTTDKPRLSVFKSSRHIYAQLIDDIKGETLASCSTLSQDAAGLAYKGNIAAAIHVGKEIAGIALGKNISAVVFDRNGFLYHGRIKALADSARESGLLF